MKRWVLLWLIAGCAGFATTLPLTFEKNAGQVDARVRYFARTSGATLWLTDSGAVLSVDGKNKRAVLRMTLDGARRHPGIEGVEAVAGKSNYFIGRDASRWKRDIPQFGAVRYEQPYPGIDLSFHADGRTIEYDWVVAPGADPDEIRMSFRGSSRMSIDSSGDLVFSIGGVEMRQKHPRIYQDGREIEGHFVRRGRSIGFEVAKYDRSRALTIDPILTYATHLGGSGLTNNEPGVLQQSGDYANAAAVDGQGNVIVVGSTSSTNFPTKSGLYMTEPNPINGYITKFNPSASGPASVIWSTYFGGDISTTVQSVAIDAQNNIYLLGNSSSSDLPVVNAFQSTFDNDHNCTLTDGSTNPCREDFVTKLSSDGTKLIYSSYLGGGEGENFPAGIAVDSTGAAWVAGYTQADNFPVRGQYYQGTIHGTQTGTVSKVSPDGSQLVYSTYLGGSSQEVFTGIALDTAGNAYVTGYTYSKNFPTVNAYQTVLPSAAARAGIVAEINPNASPSLVYSTLLDGTTSGSFLNAIAVDTKGNVYVGGATASSNFPVTSGAYQNALIVSGSEAAVVAELNPSAQPAAQIVYATYLTGGIYDVVYGIGVDKTGRIIAAGTSESPFFPTTPDAFQHDYSGVGDSSGLSAKGFLTIIDPTASGSKGLIYGTYYGGANNNDFVGALGLDPTGTIAAIVGDGYATDRFVTPSAFQPLSSAGNLGDSLIAVFNLAQSGPVISSMLDAASYDTSTNNVAPGEIVALFGSGLGPSTLVGAELDSTGHLATTLAGCQLLVNGTPAPLVYVSAAQASAILPYELTPRINTTLQDYAQMVCNGVPGNVHTFEVAASHPGIFSAASSGTGQAAVLNQDGTYNSASNPAAGGTIVTLFATGEGVLTPAGQDGRIENGPLSSIPVPSLKVTVTFGTAASPSILYAGVAPGEVDGLLQINAQVPMGLTPGSVPLAITVGTATSQKNLTIAVK